MGEGTTPFGDRFVEVDVRLEGVTPLLMHSTYGRNPTSPWAIEAAPLVAKRTRRTAAEDSRLMYLDYQNNLYFIDELGPAMPADNLEACIIAGAKAARFGQQARVSLQVSPDHVELLYSGTRKREDLFRTGRFVDVRPAKVGKSYVMRCRPRFDEWALEFQLRIVPSMMDIAAVESALKEAGKNKGLGDYRPRFGRFLLTHFDY